VLNKILIGALSACETEEDVENTFQMFKVSDFKEKTDYILKCMGNPEVFYAGRVTSPENVYYTNLSAFLTGNWRIFAEGGENAGKC
jgi:hypothetical protein